MKTIQKATKILKLFENTFDEMMSYSARYVSINEAENICHEAYIALLKENEGRYLDEKRLFRCLKQIIADRIEPFTKLQHAIKRWAIEKENNDAALFCSPSSKSLSIIKNAFTDLPDHQKRALKLTVFDGCKSSIVSLELGISENTLREWINHGLETIYKRVA